MKKKTAKTRKVLVINGPNLHLLGTRETGIYGTLGLKDLEKKLAQKAKQLKLSLRHIQSNSEGKLIDTITKGDYDFMIINPAAYTHTSVGIRDAILAVGKPVIEVHISNIYRREDFRKTSLISDVVIGVVSGLGAMGYFLALEAAESILREKKN